MKTRSLPNRVLLATTVAGTIAATAGGVTLPAATGCDRAAAIGTVVKSVGQAPTPGTPVCPGGSLSTGTGSQLDLRLGDGALIRLGSDSEIDNLELGRHGDRFALSSGTVWGIAPLRLPPHRFAVRLGAGLAGGAVAVRGSAFTAGRPSPSGPLALHAIEGRGVARLSGRQRVHFRAGYTAIAGANSLRLTTRWPAVQRALVPPAQRPPAITRLRLRDPGRGAVARLTLALDGPADVIVRVFRANRLAAMLIAHAHRGINVLAPLHTPLAAGLYIVTVQAVRGGRVTLVRRTVHVRAR